MTLWWIGNAVLFAVVIPAVVLILIFALRAALAVRRRVAEVAEQGKGVASGLDALGDLRRTSPLLREVGDGLRRYGAALDEVLPGDEP